MACLDYRTPRTDVDMALALRTSQGKGSGVDCRPCTDTTFVRFIITAQRLTLK